MSITQIEIRNFNSQINISPNIIYNAIQSLSAPSKNNTSVRIYYYINENDEIILNIPNEDQDKYNTFLFYEIIILKIDFLKNKSKMIMIYNNERKQYKIKIWASKLEKLDIKIEYNNIIKKICEKKKGNNILKNILKLIPDKYTIYYFPLTVTLFEKELVFIYILIFTRNEKSKFQNFKQIKDLILYSKSLLIPKIYNLLLKYKNNNSKVKRKSNNNINNKIKNNNMNMNINMNYGFNENKENILGNKMKKKRSNNYISPKNEEILINFDKERFRKIMNKRINSSKQKLNFMQKPYNKIVFNYSFEKNDNEISLNRIKQYQKSFIEERKPIDTIIIDTHPNRSSKVNNYMKFPINQLKKLTRENNTNLPFSISSKNNNKNNNNNIPYEKKRPSSIPKKIIHYLSTNNFNIQYRNYCNEKEKFLNNKYDTNTFDNKNILNNKNKKIIYKRKSFTKRRSKNALDSYFLKNSHSNNIFENNNSTFDNIDIDTTFSMDRNSIISSKIKKSRSILYNGSMMSLNPLIKTYGCIKDINEKHNISNMSKIPINKKTTLSINFNNCVKQNSKNDFHLNIIDGNKTSRNIINKRISKDLIYKTKNMEKNRLNRTGNTDKPKKNDSEEEITLFI